MPWILANWKPITVALLAAALFYAGWHVRGLSDNYALAKAQQAAEEHAARVDAEAQKTFSRDRANADKLNTEAEHEAANTVPCKLPDSWVHTYNQSLASR